MSDLLYQITEADLVALTDDAGAGMADTGIIASAIADADAEIDIYLGAQYDVPLSQTPDIIKKLSVDLTIYGLMIRRNLPIPPDRKDRYTAGIRVLKDIATGLISIGSVNLTSSPEAGPMASKSASDRVFTLSNLEPY
jgi:phage gp36-like protein